MQNIQILREEIIEMFTKTLKRILPIPIKTALKHLISKVIFDQWVEYSWSQEGEDRILKRIFGDKENGFYVDIGAHHPKRFSNTYLFYKLGWSGINIDAMPGSMRAFKYSRIRDINIESGVGEKKEILDYYVFNEPALNGFSNDLSIERNENCSNYQIEKIIKVEVQPLSIILDDYLHEGQNIDFMTVDVEGFDLQVLKSNDWKKYRPKYVLVESLNCSLDEISDSELGFYMVLNGYKIYAKSMNTVFFLDSTS